MAAGETVLKAIDVFYTMVEFRWGETVRENIGENTQDKNHEPWIDFSVVAVVFLLMLMGGWKFKKHEPSLLRTAYFPRSVCRQCLATCWDSCTIRTLLHWWYCAQPQLSHDHQCPYGSGDPNLTLSAKILFEDALWFTIQIVSTWDIIVETIAWLGPLL